MPLVPINGQPVRMAPFPEDSYSCDAYPEFCALHKQGVDDIRMQIRQTKCGDDLLCNPSFEYGPNVLTNGTFTGSATGWTLPAGWAYGTNNVVATAGLNALSQTIPGLINGQRYFLTITVSSIGSGVGVFANLGTGTDSTPITANGTYVIPIVAGAGADLQIFAYSDATIDDIQLVTVDCWTAGSGFNFDSGAACHTAGTADDLYENIYTSFVAGDYLYLKYTISGMSAGSIDVIVGGFTVRTVTQNGTYEDYIAFSAGDTLLKFSVTSLFDGCISPNESYPLSNLTALSLGFSFVDLDGNGVTVLDSDQTMTEDRFSVRIGTSDLAEGCYRIRMIDPCPDFKLGPETEINDDVEFANPSAWALFKNPSAGTFQVSGGKLSQSFSTGGGGATNIANVAFQPQVWPAGMIGGQFTIVLQTGAYSGGVSPDITLLLPGSQNGNPFVTQRINTIPSVVTPNTTYTISFAALFDNSASSNFLGQSLYNKFGINLGLGGFGNPTINEILSCSIKFNPLYEITGTDGILVSNCLSVRTDTMNARKVYGLSDSDRSVGFIFDNTVFPRIESRLFLSFTNPHNPVSQAGYLYSSGDKKKTFAQDDKLWDLVFHAVDQNMHDTIQRMLSMDHFRIGDSLTKYVEYEWQEKEYDADYGKKGVNNVAESSVEISRKSGVVFK